MDGRTNRRIKLQRFQISNFRRTVDGDLVIVASFSFCFLVTDNSYFLCNRARRQIIYPVDQLGGNAPSKRILANKVTDLLLLFVRYKWFGCFWKG